MSRTRNALVTAIFTYVNFGLAIVSGIVLVPLILRAVGAHAYGLWLTTAELLAYAGMLDVGVLGILPWLVAQADGRGDVAEIRSLLSRALVIAAGAGIVLAVVVFGAGPGLLSALSLARGDFEAVVGPLLVVAALMAVTYPLRIFYAALVGLQDVMFTGGLAVSQTALSIGLTLWLLAEGYGLYAVAAAAVVPPAAAALASVVRLRSVQPAVFGGWPAPDVRRIRAMLVDGVGAWIGGVGWTMVAATSAIVITFLGHPEAVVVYACTAKLSQISFHLSRVLPDSTLVGLAQIDGAQQRQRLRRAITTILRVHLVLSGAAAIVALSFNRLFVTVWVGDAFFGGAALNLALVGALVSMSLAHGLVSCAAVLGYRRHVGMVTIAYGILTVTLAVLFGRGLGLAGVAMAPIVSGAVTTLPAGMFMLRRMSILSLRWFVRELWLPWAMRFVPVVTVIGLAAMASDRVASDHVIHSVLGVGSIVVYTLTSLSLCRDLPLAAALYGRLRRLGVARLVLRDEAKTWG